ncbi:xanthine dehydrogenase family protein subunit M [Sphingobium sp. SJ10-10]|uniref:FAD binding domain-containing protein n=1 Tax=Sphingobium sp. SJ10-10 TaxID=3114999 RepID=UPI002E18C0B6|nr:xanthine dehydrogenase family protein subunit M [Sphingobium sp. SJ10-10]
MKFPPFSYACPTSIAEAIELLNDDEDSRPLAGGQSLLPMMALRVAAPGMLVDLGGIDMLRQSAVLPDSMRIGAMVTHAANAASLDIWMHFPLMSQALHHVAHQAVRNRGTFGGSIAHADAGAEMPLVVSALDGMLLLQGPGGARALPAADFFQGHYTTAIEPGEILTGVELPFSGMDWAFEEMARRSGDLAIAMAAAGVRVEDGICREARLMFGSISDRPIRAAEAEAYLAERELTPSVIREAAAMAASGIHARSDTHASADYRLSLATALMRRALTRLATGAM